MSAARRAAPAAVLLAAALLEACSHRALYETVRQDRLRRCERLPIAQQAACKDQYRTTYDEYRRGLERARASGEL